MDSLHVISSTFLISTKSIYSDKKTNNLIFIFTFNNALCNTVKIDLFINNYIYKNTERSYLIKSFTIYNYMSRQCFHRVLFATRRNLAALYRSRAACVYHVVILSWIHSSELFALRITNRTNSGAFVNKFRGERTESGTARYKRVE